MYGDLRIQYRSKTIFWIMSNILWVVEYGEVGWWSLGISMFTSQFSQTYIYFYELVRSPQLQSFRYFVGLEVDCLNTMFLLPTSILCSARGVKRNNEVFIIPALKCPLFQSRKSHYSWKTKAIIPLFHCKNFHYSSLENLIIPCPLFLFTPRSCQCVDYRVLKW